MRKILNLLITALVFWLGSKYFPEYISISDTKTLIIVTVGMFVLSWAYTWVLGLSVLTTPVLIGCLPTLILILAAFVWTPVRLLILEHFVPGFEVNGFWTYVLLMIIFSIFLIKAPSTDSNNTNTTETKPANK